MEELNLNNIGTGQVIKNYKEFCALLEIKPRTGKSKIIQQEKIGEFIDYHKEGNKIIIDKIKAKRALLMDKRQLGNTCKTAIEIGDVILHKLLEDYKGEELVITQTELLYRLMLITDDYKQFLYNTELYHKNTGIDYKYLNEYRLKVGNQINKRIVNALNRLEKSGYILYNKQQNLIFKMKNKEGESINHRYSITEEVDKKKYIDCKLRAFDKLNALRILEDKPAIKDVSMIFVYGELKRFKKLSCEELSNVFNEECINFWDAYVISTTKLALDKVLDDKRYNGNIDYIKRNFYELLENVTKNIREQELQRLRKLYKILYKQETENVTWGEPARFESDKILFIIENIEKMSYTFIY